MTNSNDPFKLMSNETYPPAPAGLRKKEGVDYGCEKPDCTDCYEPGECWSDIRDTFGRVWREVPATERCRICGQPDSCGDCTHEAMALSEALKLGAELPKHACTEDYVGNERDGVSVTSYDAGDPHWAVLVSVDSDTGGFCDSMAHFDSTTHDTVDEAVEAGLEIGKQWCSDNDVAIGRLGDILEILEEFESLCMDSEQDRLQLAAILDERLPEIFP